MKVSKEDLKRKLVKAAHKVVSKKEAEYFADEIVEAFIRKSPRCNILKEGINDLEASQKNKKQKIHYDVNLGSYLAINFQSQGPLAYIHKVHDEIEHRSAKNGIAMVSFLNSQSMHTLHTWVQGLAKRGLVAIAVCNGGPGAVVPFNGTRGLFGTNPMAYALPAENGEIQCVDMATSQIPYFEIMAAHKNKQKLPVKSAVDKNGNFTRDPEAALDFTASATDPVSNIVPMGGDYKGYYLVYLMELLTSGLIGLPSSPEMTQDVFVPEEHGAILIAFNPKAMGTIDKLKGSVKSLGMALRAERPKSGEKIIVPGENNNKKLNESVEQTELEVDDELLQKLETLL